VDAPRPRANGISEFQAKEWKQNHAACRAGASNGSKRDSEGRGPRSAHGKSRRGRVNAAPAANAATPKKANPLPTRFHAGSLNPGDQGSRWKSIAPAAAGARWCFPASAMNRRLLYGQLLETAACWTFHGQKNLQIYKGNLKEIEGCRF